MGECCMIEASDYPNRAIGRRILAPSEAVDRQVVAVNLTESPLGWRARRGMLTALQLAAGERLRGGSCARRFGGAGDDALGGGAKWSSAAGWGRHR